MKTILAIVLVGLLGFLGCSGDDNGTNAIGDAIPVAPFGITDTMTPTYEWTPVQYATRYCLLVQNVAEETIIEEWFTAEEGECSSEEGLCMVTPEIEIIGAYTWKILACLGENCGLWSDTLSFSYDVMGPPQERFTDNGDGTVTDNNTMIIWTKNANRVGEKNWYDALYYCDFLTLAKHSGWRLPSISELRSLIDRTQINPALPLGHPFTNLQCTENSFYPTSESCRTDTSFAYALECYYGWKLNRVIKPYPHFTPWCVSDDN